METTYTNLKRTNKHCANAFSKGACETQCNDCKNRVLRTQKRTQELIKEFKL